MTLFRKVMKTTFHYESFLEFYSAHFGIKIEPCFIKKKFLIFFGQIFLTKFFFYKTWYDFYIKMCRIKF